VNGASSNPVYLAVPPLDAVKIATSSASNQSAVAVGVENVVPFIISVVEVAGKFVVFRVTAMRA
jgi:hypothetical protein